MKRYLAIILCLALLLPLWGCGSAEPANSTAPAGSAMPVDSSLTKGLRFYDDYYYKNETIYLISDGKPVSQPTSLFSCEVSLDGQAYPVSFLWAIINEELRFLPPEDHSLCVESIGKNTDVAHVSIYVKSQEKTYHYLANLFTETLTPIGPETELNIKELSLSPDLSCAVATLGKNEAIAYYDGEKWTDLDLTGDNISGLFLENGTCLVSSIEVISETSPKTCITLYTLHCDTGILAQTVYQKVLLSDDAGLSLYGSRYATDTSGNYLSIVDLVLDTAREVPVATEDIKNISASRELFIVYLKSGELYAIKKASGQIIATGMAPNLSATSYYHVLSDDSSTYVSYFDIETNSYPLYLLSASVPTGEPLTEEELRWFNEDFFHYRNAQFNIRNMFLACEFDHPANIDFGLLFREGLGYSGNISQAEKDLYNEAIGYELDLDYIKISREDMETVFQNCTGLQPSQAKKTGLDKLVYLELYDAYYHCHGDTAYIVCDFESGERANDGTVSLYYKHPHSLDDALWCVTLRLSGDNYLFVSNLPAE